jgi:hypothetical protein
MEPFSLEQLYISNEFITFIEKNINYTKDQQDGIRCTKINYKNDIFSTNSILDRRYDHIERKKDRKEQTKDIRNKVVLKVVLADPK